MVFLKQLWLGLLSWLGLGRASPATALATVRSRFDLSHIVLKLSEFDGVTLDQLLASVHIWGGTGSGKTSSAGYCLAMSLMRLGAGFLFLCVKPGDRYDYLRYARRAGRENQVILIEPGGDVRLNWLDYELRRDKGGLTENLLNLLTIVTNIVEGTKDIAQAADPYWERAMRVLLRNAIDIFSIAQETLTLEKIHNFIISAPRSVEEIDEESWRSSYCARMIAQAEAAPKNERQAHDFAKAAQYYLVQFPNMPERTRGSVISSLDAVADTMMHGVLWELFSTTTTVVPENIWQEGAIVIVDIDFQNYGEVARIAGGLFKFITQKAMLRRDVSQCDRPAVIWCDEASTYLSPFDYSFASQSRSSRSMSVYLNQSIANYYASMGAGGKESTDALMSNFQTHIMLANADPQTNEWASNLIGKHWMTTHGWNSGQPGKPGGPTASGSEAINYKVLPETFTRLRRGGPPLNYTEAVVFQGGRIWQSGDTYLMTIFPQEPRDGM